MSTYLREMEHAKRDVIELCAQMLDYAPATGHDLTVTQLAQAIGLANTAHRALLAAFGARHVTPASPQPVTSRRGLELIGRTP